MKVVLQLYAANLIKCWAVLFVDDTLVCWPLFPCTGLLRTLCESVCIMHIVTVNTLCGLKLWVGNASDFLFLYYLLKVENILSFEGTCDCW